MATFGRDTFTYGLAVLTDRIVGLILLPLLTSNLDKRDFGAWSQIHAAYGFFSTALLLGFFYTVSSLTANRSAREVAQVYTGILALVLVTTGGFSILCVLWPTLTSRVLFADTSYNDIIPVMAWFVTTECFYELVVLAFLRSQGKIGRCSFYYGSKSLLRLLIVWLGLSTEKPLINMLGLLGLVNAIMVLYVLRRNALPAGMASPAALGRAFWRMAVVGAAATAATILLAWANGALNRFLIVHFEGLDKLAIYSANYSILSIVTLVPMIFTFTLLHHLSRKFAAGSLEEAREIIDQSVAYYLYITLPLLALAGLFYKQLLALLAPGGYSAGLFLPTTLMGYFFTFGLEQILVFSTFPGGGAKALRARLAALGLNLLCGFALIPIFGLKVAALPPLGASLAIVIMCAATLRNRLGYRFPWSAFLGIGGAGLVMISTGWALVMGLEPRGWWSVVFASVVLGFVYLLTESLRPASLTRELLAGLGIMGLLRTYMKRHIRR